MATALKLRADIKKLKKALETKGISASVKDKLKTQLEKAEAELAAVKKGKAPKTSSTKGTKTALSKLQSLVKRKKYGAYRAQGVDLKKDADRPALPSGKRKSKSGNTYYEYRANRIDVKQPPKRYPKLEDGGYMAKGGETHRYEKGGYMEKGGRYLRKLPTEENLYVFMVLDKKNGFGSLLDAMVYSEYETKYVKEKFENKLAKGQELKMFSVKELLERKSLPDSSKDRIKKSFENKVDSIKNVMEVLGFDDYAKLEKEGMMEDGGYMARGGKLSLSDFKKKYEENEDNNYHSENVVLLAENFGTDQDIKDAKRILALHDAIGSLPSFLANERRELEEKLWQKYQAASK